MTTNHGRYVQGGGCLSVGAVGGFLQGGGFGSFSKKYGLAAGSLLEAEVVIANGDILIANAYQHADLFWALKGGGGGTFGIVTKATVLTHDLPKYFGILKGRIKAHTDQAFLELLEAFIHFYRAHLCNEHWGEKVVINSDNTLDLFLAFQGLEKGEAEKIWKPFKQWVAEHSTLYTMSAHFTLIPAKKLWDYDYLSKNVPELPVKLYQGENEKLFDWAVNQSEVLSYRYAIQSRWLPLSLFEKERPKQLAKALFDASRYWDVDLYLSKGLAEGSAQALRQAQETSINPIVFESAALVLLGAKTQHVIPGIPHHEPNLKEGLERLQKVNAAAKMIEDLTPYSGSYSNETDYFQTHWQQDFWGEHYARLLKIKRKYDPENLFRCHHGVGSEE